MTGLRLEITDGVSGVKNLRYGFEDLYIKVQTDHLHHSVKHPLGRPTALREAEAIRALDRLGILVPQIVFCGSRRNAGHEHTILVTKGLEGFLNLDEFVSQARNQSKDVRSALIEALAQTLGTMHRSRWQHSALYPKHIFVSDAATMDPPGNGIAVALIDLEKSRRRLTANQASRHDLSQLHRHFTGFDDAEWRSFFSHHDRCLRT